MDVIFNKITLIEVSITLVLFYIFPKASILIYGIPILLYFFYNNQKKQSKLVTNNHMNAALYSYSDLHSYKSIKIPKFGPEEVLVQVKGASINPIDKIQTTKIPFLRWWFPWTIGRDVAGIIVDIGANVRKFQIGEQVYGKAVGGSLQEYTNCNQDQIAHKPNNTSFVEAASLGLAGLTSLQSLNWFRN